MFVWTPDMIRFMQAANERNDYHARLAAILAPKDYVGTIMELCQSRRGTLIGMDYLGEDVPEHVGERKQERSAVGQHGAELDQLGGADVRDQQQAAEDRNDDVVVAGSGCRGWHVCCNPSLVVDGSGTLGT